MFMFCCWHDQHKRPAFHTEVRRFCVIIGPSRRTSRHATCAAGGKKESGFGKDGGRRQRKNGKGRFLGRARLRVECCVDQVLFCRIVLFCPYETSAMLSPFLEVSFFYLLISTITIRIVSAHF